MSRPRLIALVLLAVVVGYGAVQLLIGGGHGDTAKPAVTSSTTGTTSGFRDGRSGADRPAGAAVRPRWPVTVAVADRYLQLLDDPSTAAAAALKVVTVAPLRARALGAEAAATSLRRGFPRGTFAGGWRLGWRIEKTAPRRSTVAIWTVGLVAGPGEVIAPYWSTTVCTLRLIGGSWRISSAHTLPGPTPPTPDSPQSAIGRFARAADTFHQFGDAT